MDYYQSKDYISDYQGVAPSLHLASMRLSIYELDIAVTTFVLTFISFFLVSSWKVGTTQQFISRQCTCTYVVNDNVLGLYMFQPSRGLCGDYIVWSEFLEHTAIQRFFERKNHSSEKKSSKFGKYHCIKRQVIKKLGGVICSISKSKESSLTKSMKGVSQHISKNWTDHYISIVLLYMY